MRNHGRNHGHLHGGHHNYGCHLNRGGHHIFTGNRTYGHPMSSPHSRVYFVGSLGQRRSMMKCMAAFGVVLLTISVILIFCGILGIAGVIGGDTFSFAAPLLGFGGVTLLAGIGFTAISCISLKHSPLGSEQTETFGQAESSIPPPSGSGYPPPEYGYPPPASGYPPPESAYPQAGSNYPPPGSAYPPPGSAYPPPPGLTYPPPGSAYPPPGSAYPPPGSAYSPPPGLTYPPPGSAYPPPGSAYPPPGSAYPPPGSVYSPPG